MSLRRSIMLQVIIPECWVTQPARDYGIQATWHLPTRFSSVDVDERIVWKTKDGFKARKQPPRWTLQLFADPYRRVRACGALRLFVMEGGRDNSKLRSYSTSQGCSARHDLSCVPLPTKRRVILWEDEVGGCGGTRRAPLAITKVTLCFNSSAFQNSILCLG